MVMFLKERIQNIIIHIRLFPFYVKYAYTKILNFLLPPKIDISYWNDLKKDLQFDTFLVVANGPSLNFSDLENLSHLPSIASNKIYLGFGDSKWRPSLWTISDSLLAYKISKDKYAYKSIINCPDKLYYFLSNKLRTKCWKSVDFSKLNELNNKKIIDPFLTGFYEAGTVTVFNIQLAIWMGAKTIYITGLDHFYKEQKHTLPGQKIKNCNNNHFHPMYRKKNEIINNAPLDLLENSYKLINQYAKKNKVKIINISNKSSCNVFDRMSINKVKNYK